MQIDQNYDDIMFLLYMDELEASEGGIDNGNEWNECGADSEKHNEGRE